MKKEIRTIERQMFISADGIEFNEAWQCREHEYKWGLDRIRKNGNVIEATEAENMLPYGFGEDDTDGYLYRWFFVKNKQGLDDLVTTFGLDSYGYDSERINRWIGQWICLECEDGIGNFNCRVHEMSATEQKHDELLKKLSDALYSPDGCHIVNEVCPNCDAEVELTWDVKRDGYKAYCPHCGAVLMLCDECQHRTGGKRTEDCDYDSKTGACRFNKPKAE